MVGRQRFSSILLGLSEAARRSVHTSIARLVENVGTHEYTSRYVNS